MRRRHHYRLMDSACKSKNLSRHQPHRTTNIGDNAAMKNSGVTPADDHRHGLAAAGVVVGVVAGVVMLFALTLGARVGHAQEAALVTTDAVVKQAFTQTIPIIGRLIAKQSGVAAARIDGTVSAIFVQVGDRVSRGQALATLDTATLKLQMSLAEARRTEAMARLKTAEAQVALADQEVKRLSGLADSAAVSKAAHDDARQRLNIASARLQEAVAAISSSAAAVRLAELNLAYAGIAAPFDGTITARLTEVGSYLQRGQTVVRLISDRRLELEADVPYDRLSGLSRGAEVDMLLDNGSVHRATARAVIPEEDPKTRTRRVRFTTDLGADAGLLAAQQSVTVLVPVSAQRDIVSVHKDALVRRGRDSIVFVVEDGRTAIRTIRTGVSSGTRIEVLDGLQPGDQAVVRGNERLQPGQEVVVSNVE